MLAALEALLDRWRGASDPDPELQAWIDETYAWAVRELGADGASALVEPTDRFFPDRARNPEEAARLTFAQVKAHAGMESWECELVAQPADPDPRVQPHLALQGAPSSPAGTYRGRRGDAATITYDPELVRDPEALVATFAHELAHFRMSRVRSRPPGGAEHEEPATDLVAVFLGFGVFVANSAFSFRQYTDTGSQGWQARRQGYLGERELTYALARFCHHRGTPTTTATRHLDPHLRPLLRRALRRLRAGR